MRSSLRDGDIFDSVESFGRKIVKRQFFFLIPHEVWISPARSADFTLTLSRFHPHTVWISFPYPTHRVDFTFPEENTMNIHSLRVALDGPSGAGKSSVAKALAEKIGLIYVDTGALYRAVGLYMAEHSIDAYDTEKIIAALPDVDISLSYENGEQVVRLCGENIGGKIRTEQASYYASAVSKIPEVRAFLLKTQQDIASRGGVVMDGRDIGTVIMPDAELKVFMTASPEERARRRYVEQIQKGVNVTYDEVLENIVSRDKQDSERSTAPLKPADDAIVFENDGYNVDQSVEVIVKLIKHRAESIK